jgi:Zn-dependent metalloprotease
MFIQSPLRLLGVLLSLGTPTLAALADEPVERARERRAAQGALAALERGEDKLRVVWPEGRSAPALVAGLAVQSPGDRPEERAQSFLSRWSALTALSLDELHLSAVETAGSRTTVRYAQMVNGLPVEGRSLSITLEGTRVISLVNEAAPLRSVDRATIDADSARVLAVQAVFGAGPEAPSLEIATEATKAIAVVGDHGVEVFKVFVARRPLHEHLEVLVDAHQGRVIGIADRVVG